MARRRRGRPSNQEKEVTVVSGGQLNSMPTKSSGTRGYELGFMDDLIKRKGFEVYREMLHDDQVKACLAFKKVLVTGRTFELVPANGDDASEEDKEVAKFVEDNLNDLQWQDIQENILSSLDFGFSTGELIWQVKEYKDKGLRVHLGDVKHRDPQDMKVHVDIHGNIVEYIQEPQTFAGQIIVPKEKIIHHCYQGRFSNHYGIPDTRAAYRAWFSKKFVTQFWNVFLERFGQPLMKMNYPQGASPELKAALKSILDGLSSKTDILVPEGVEIDLIEATRAGTAQYGDALTHFDIAISKAILTPALLGMGTDIKRGSDSQSRLHLRVLMKVAAKLSQSVSFAVQNSIVKPLVDFNFNVKEYPKYVYGDYGEYEAVEITDAIVGLHNAGIIEMDQEDVNYVRSVVGMPLRDEDNEDDVLRTPPPPIGGSPNNPNASGDGAKDDNKRAKQKTKRADAEERKTIVNVTLPSMHIHSPENKFESTPEIKFEPIINIPEPNVKVVINPSGKNKKIVRNSKGEITDIVES